jgi:hypothetical protein
MEEVSEIVEITSMIFEPLKRLSGTFEKHASHGGPRPIHFDGYVTTNPLTKTLTKTGTP